MNGLEGHALWTVPMDSLASVNGLDGRALSTVLMDGQGFVDDLDGHVGFGKWIQWTIRT